MYFGKGISNERRSIMISASYQQNPANVISANPNNCTFCSLIANVNDNSLIKRFDYGSLFVNFNQYFKGRVMYVFHRHAHDITSIDENELINAEREILSIAKLTKQIFQPELINVASLGNHVQHLHWHIIPRYRNEPTWGNPPWPHERLIVDDLQVAQLRELYREKLNWAKIQRIVAWPQSKHRCFSSSQPCLGHP